MPKAGAQSILIPTLFVGGADTEEACPCGCAHCLPEVPDAWTATIPGCGRWMFEQAP